MARGVIFAHRAIFFTINSGKLNGVKLYIDSFQSGPVFNR